MAKRKINIEELQRQKGVKITPITRVVLAVLVVAAIAVGLFAVANSISQSKELPESEKITRSLSGKSLLEDRTDALNTVKGMLEATNAPATIGEATDTIGQLEAGDFSGFDPSYSDYVRYYDAYEENADFQAEVAMSVYTVASLAKEAKGGEIIADDSILNTIRVDQETGIAQVPLDIFTGNESPVAFQMVYVDGSWKLEPHTFSSYIRISAGLQAGSSAG